MKQQLIIDIETDGKKYRYVAKLKTDGNIENIGISHLFNTPEEAKKDADLFFSEIKTKAANNGLELSIVI